MTYLLVANPSSGSGEDDLRERAVRELGDVRTFELREGADLRGAVGAAVAEGRIVVACGGDGTVHAVVQHLAGGDGILGVLPSGTFNHFARDLGVDEPDSALRTLRDGAERRVDVGRADGRAFVDNVSIGMYAQLVRERERHEDRLGRLGALLVSAANTFRRFEPFEAVISADGDARAARCALIFVSNNRVSALGRRDRLDEGVLDVRVVRSGLGLRGRSGMAWRVLRGSGPYSRVVRTTARSVAVRLPRGARHVALDGEAAEDRSSLEISIEPRALRVLAPAPGA
ncbi:MAG: hypothetical protein LC722_00070 [Actinobacteria bacterium]|nr:hypothetical protein [Actinomycetota bacterium]